MMLRYLIILFALMLLLAVFVVHPVKADEALSLPCWHSDSTGIICIPGADRAFADSYLSVREQESGDNPLSHRITRINGVDYDVRSCMQLLLDGATRPLTASLGYSVDDLYDCQIATEVAYAWWEKVGWSHWQAKAKYTVEGWHD